MEENILNKYWRIGTSDGDTSYWDLMLNENKICIGWKEIGDLENNKVEEKNHIIDLLSDEGFYKNDNRTKSRKAGEILDFYKNIKVGDIVLAQRGFDVLGIGRIIEDYTFNEQDDFPHQKEVEWLVISPNIINEQGNRTSVYEITDRNIINNLTKILKDKSNNTMETKNIFELYKVYLKRVKIETGEITKRTAETYYKSVKEKVPIKWSENFSEPFDKNNLEYRFLKKLSSIIFLEFQGSKTFIPFLDELIEKHHTSPNLNQILYGPPGTGKTYKTKELAVEIIDGFIPERREELTNRYFELMESGQIHFTTFHQSMSYEDFIEGIKPKMKDGSNGELEYEVKPGIFKKICETAKTKEQTNFDTAYTNFLKDFSENEDVFLDLETPRGSQFSLKLNSNNNLTLFTTKNRNQYGTLTMERLNDFYLGNPVFNGWQGYATGFLKYLEKHYHLSKEEKQPNQKYVLIIDEINRGNISAIFGELITLIEPDKRAGQKEAIQVTLPYSNHTDEKFSVPDNVYIIGTMNTADRSVEALDTALRRRFSFEEISPKPELLVEVDYSEVNLVELLKTINQRIELLLDKDHQIGHSYFFKIQNFEDLKITFKDKIIPLLEEYFYGDFGKIGLVLGGHFVKSKEGSNINILAKNFEFETDFIEEKELYDLQNHNDWTLDTFTSIYMNTPIENE